MLILMSPELPSYSISNNEFRLSIFFYIVSYIITFIFIMFAKNNFVTPLIFTQENICSNEDLSIQN